MTITKGERIKRILQIIFGIFFCITASGVVFGYAALKPVLIQEGVYRTYCTREELEKDVFVCKEQELKLNLLFMVAAVVANLMALPIGSILDNLGPRITAIVGAVLFFLGNILFGMGEINGIDLYLPGYFFLGLGGPFIFISSLHLSNTFPSLSGTIMATLTGAFDSSSCVYLLYRLFYNKVSKLPLHSFFLAYAVVPVIVLIVQIVLMPKESYQGADSIKAEANPSEDINSIPPLDGGTLLPNERTHLLSRSRSVSPRSPRMPGSPQMDSRARLEAKSPRFGPYSATFGPSSPRLRVEGSTPRLHNGLNPAEIEGENDDRLYGRRGSVFASHITHAEAEELQTKNALNGVLFGKSIKTQLLTPFFVLIVLFTVANMLRINYYIATIFPQLAYLLGYEAAEQINTVFDVALPLGGIIMIPFIGLLLDNTSTVFSLTVLLVISSIIGVLNIIPTYWAQLIVPVMIALFRPFYYTSVSDYCAKIFGFQTFGTVYGLTISIAGIFNLLQQPLNGLTLSEFGGNPLFVNSIILVLGVITGVAIVGFAVIKARQRTKELKHAGTNGSA